MAPSKWASIEVAVAEREQIITEVLELQQWLSGVGNDRNGAFSSTDYQRQRAAKVHRIQRLQIQARELRVWIKKANAEKTAAAATAQSESTRKPRANGTLLTKLFHAVCELQESGVDVGSQVEDVLNEIEMEVPPRILAERRGE